MSWGGLTSDLAWEVAQWATRFELRADRYGRNADGVILQSEAAHLGRVCYTVWEFVDDRRTSGGALLQFPNRVGIENALKTTGVGSLFSGAKQNNRNLKVARQILQYIFLGDTSEGSDADDQTLAAYNWLNSFFNRSAVDETPPRFFESARALHPSPYTRTELTNFLFWLCAQVERLGIKTKLTIVSGGRGFTHDSKYEFDRFIDLTNGEKAFRAGFRQLFEAGVVVQLVLPPESKAPDADASEASIRSIVGSRLDKLKVSRVHQEGPGFLSPADVYLFAETTVQGKPESILYSMRATEWSDNEVLAVSLTEAAGTMRLRRFKAWLESCCDGSGEGEGGTLGDVSNDPGPVDGSDFDDEAGESESDVA